MELNNNKSIQNYTLVLSKKIHSSKGQKGFVKKKPQDIQNEYCKLNKISMTDLFLGSLECYTGFNGSNQEDILNPLREYIEMEQMGC